MPTINDAFANGLEVCVKNPPKNLAGGRLGLLANQASVDHNFRYSWNVLAARFPGQLASIFSPQHGLWGDQQANMHESAHGFDDQLRVPIHSLYSETRRPTREMLDGLDAFVIDLQDVGTRVYTFAWTVSFCLEACAAAQIPVFLLDRPNPLGGRLVDGPLLDTNYTSFVGRAAIPMRHALTLGELAALLNRELGISADLHVVPMRGWSRSMTFEETCRAWLAPSPNLPRLKGVELYPGQVLLEGTNLSEGRGTTTPFEVVGAPFIAPVRLVNRVEEFALPGVAFRPIRFTPTFDKWNGTSCGGVSLHVTDSSVFSASRTTVAVLAAVKHLWPNDFAWIDPPYEYESQHMPIDIISGSDRLRTAFEAEGDIDNTALDNLCGIDRDDWWKRVGPHLIY